MRIWLAETRVANPGGHELELDRVLVEELRGLGHKVELALPSDYGLELNYPVYVKPLAAKGSPLPQRSFLGRLKRSLFSEVRRRSIFNEIASRANEYDAAIIPSATYRFLRSAKMSELKRSKKPVIFLGFESPPKVGRLMADQLRSLGKPNKIKVLVNCVSFGGDTYGLDNYFLAPPPAFTPRDVPWRPAPDGPLVFGFFGQYRREKNLGGLLEAILAAKLKSEAKFVVQINPITPEDRAEAEALVKRYANIGDKLTFIHGQLDNKSWQEALLGVHAILMPYGAERFRWNWSSMLFSAIGFKRAVLTTETLNPAVLEKFKIGRVAKDGDFGSLREALERLAEDFDDPALYRDRLDAAFEFYHPRRLA
ncbi:MAG: hypothetical protein LBE49_01300, partial [Deltaproteobacteria bacterium]|nr:hypothetical protein [Deltaproteobacteria bacterium]